MIITEQMILMVTIHNNWSEDIDALVTLPKSTAYTFINIDINDVYMPYLSDGEHQVNEGVVRGGITRR